jgi:hypothetical protein
VRKSAESSCANSFATRAANRRIDRLRLIGGARGAPGHTRGDEDSHHEPEHVANITGFPGRRRT